MKQTNNHELYKVADMYRDRRTIYPIVVYIIPKPDQYWFSPLFCP